MPYKYYPMPNKPRVVDAEVAQQAKAANAQVVDKFGKPCAGLPASYSNIDDAGNVLFLDEARLQSHARPEKPLYKARPHGLGLFDAFFSRFSARGWNFKGYAAVFRVMQSVLHWVSNPKSLGSKALRTALIMPTPESGHTYATAYNLNVDDAPQQATTIDINLDLSHKAKSDLIPIDMVKAAILNADYIGAMDACLCRTANRCEHYPHDLACLFLGVGGRTVVDHGLAQEVTKEEALARVDEAAKLGLVCQSLWVQIEQIVWGIKNQDMPGMVEICFCCPCCCTAMNLSRYGTEDIHKRFAPSGYTAVVDTHACIGCGKCADPYCPQDAIHFRVEDGKMVVNQDRCMGCGYCKYRCPTHAIKIKQTMPMRESMHEYFLEEGRLDLVVD